MITSRFPLAVRKTRTRQPLANAGTIDRPAAIRADTRSIRHANTRRSDPDSWRDTHAGRSGADARRDADTGRSGIMRPHDTSMGNADGPAIDLGLRRRGDERQEKNRESNPVQHHDLRCHL